jgi:hypothetical protein
LKPLPTTIWQIEFALEKAEHGMAMPYDAERVDQLRNMLREARKRKLSTLRCRPRSNRVYQEHRAKRGPAKSD